MLINPRDEQKQWSAAVQLSRAEKIAVIVISLAILTALFLFPHVTRAADAPCAWDADCLSWNYNAILAPPAVPTGLVSHRVETAKADTGPWTVVATVPLPAMTYVRQPVSGTNYYRIVAVYADGALATSNVGTSTVIPPAPVLQVVHNVGYQLNLGSNNRIYFSRVGTVPLGKECIVGMNVMDKHVIQSREWLVLDANRTRPRQVFASCRAG